MDPIVFWVLVGLLIVYEVWTLLDKKPGNHITAIVRRTGAKYPLFVFALGMLMGHFFW